VPQALRGLKDPREITPGEKGICRQLRADAIQPSLRGEALRLYEGPKRLRQFE
jgi:hypothetical protein